jgi:hypothetical protein
MTQYGTVHTLSRKRISQRPFPKLTPADDTEGGALDCAACSIPGDPRGKGSGPHL